MHNISYAYLLRGKTALLRMNMGEARRCILMKCYLSKYGILKRRKTLMYKYAN